MPTPRAKRRFIPQCGVLPILCLARPSAIRGYPESEGLAGVVARYEQRLRLSLTDAERRDLRRRVTSRTGC